MNIGLINLKNVVRLDLILYVLLVEHLYKIPIDAINSQSVPVY